MSCLDSKISSVPSINSWYLQPCWPLQHTHKHTHPQSHKDPYPQTRPLTCELFFKNRQIFYVLSFRRVNTGANYTSCLNHFPTFHSKHEYNFNETCTMCFIFKTERGVTERFGKIRFTCVCLYKSFVFLAGLALKIER